MADTCTGICRLGSFLSPHKRFVGKEAQQLFAHLSDVTGALWIELNARNVTTRLPLERMC